MVIIYNIKGLLVGLLGLFVGAAVFAVTRSLAVGLLGVATIWCWLGRSRTDEETGAKRPAPSVYFVPLFYWGLLVAVAAFPASLVKLADAKNGGQPVADHPNADQFKRDEAGLKTNESDDPELSAALLSSISKTRPGEPVNMRIRCSADSVLVLIKLPDLKKIREPDRRKLLDAVREGVGQHRPGVKVFAGIKGKLLYGAISTPTQQVEVGTVVSERPLFDFYQSAATPEKAAVESHPNEIPESGTASQPDPTDSEKTIESDTKPETTNHSTANKPRPSDGQ